MAELGKVEREFAGCVYCRQGPKQNLTAPRGLAALLIWHLIHIPAVAGQDTPLECNNFKSYDQTWVLVIVGRVGQGGDPV